MPFFNDGVDNQLYNEVTKLQADALSAMGKCRDKLAGGTAAAALTLWFGDASPAFAKEMKEKVAKMRSVLNSQDIKCKSTTKTIVTPLQGTVLGGKANENAMAVHYNGGIFGQNNTVTRMTETQTFIQISPNFLNLPTTAQGVAATWNGQDKLETLLHELSHYVFGTKDELLDDGTNAYEAQNARLLAVQSTARAKQNAENWAFLIENLGS